MNERLVEDWLAKANERLYQRPFAPSLIAEGMEVLRVAHSPHEHGKDVIAVDKKGKVHAYQLKDGDLDLKNFEKDLGQIIALVETQVEHPAISGQPRHQPWLVVSLLRFWFRVNRGIRGNTNPTRRNASRNYSRAGDFFCGVSPQFHLS